MKGIFFSLAVLSSYCAVGFILNFLIKAVTRQYLFPYPVTIFLSQALGIFFIANGILKKRDPSFKPYKLSGDKEDLKGTIWLAVFYVLNGICSISGLNYNSIPIYLAGRKCMVLFAVLVKYASGQQEKVTRSMLVASGVITTAALVAMQGDFQNGTLLGYFILFCADLFTVLYYEVSGKLQNDNKKDTTVLLQQNAMVSILPILAICLLQGELSSSLQIFIASDYQLEITVCLLLMSVTIFIMQYTLYLATKYTSPFAIVLAGNFKDIFATCLSLLIFKDVNLSTQVALSLTLSFVGSFGYCVSKFFEEQAKKQKDQRD